MEANNEEFSFIAVMKKTHQKADGSYVDERARTIAEKFDEEMQERLSLVQPSNGELATDPVTVEEKNEIYVKVAGISKQGRVFGLGSLQSGSIQSGVRTAVDASSNSPQAAEEDGSLTLRVQELESELQKSHDENIRFQKRFEAMEIIVKTAFGENVLTSMDPSTHIPQI